MGETTAETKPANRNPFVSGLMWVGGALVALIVALILIDLIFGVSLRFRWIPDGGMGVNQNIASPSSLPAVGTKSNDGWANHGQNSQCEGKPKFSRFTCTSPATGKRTTCFCD